MSQRQSSSLTYSGGITWQHVALAAVALLVSISSVIGTVWGLPMIQRITDTQQQLVLNVARLTDKVEGLTETSQRHGEKIEQHGAALIRGGLVR